MRDVIIVGAGIGGLATGLRLASKGYKVSIYEKNDFIGGRVHRIQDNGFTFDSTASIALMPNDYRELFSSCNLEIEDYLKIYEPKYSYRLFNTESKSITLFNDFSDISKELEIKSDMSASRYLDFINEGYKKYEITDKNFLSNPMTRMTDLFNGSNLKKMLRLNPLTTCYDELSKYIDDKLIRDAFAYQTMYVGVSPFEASAVYSIIPAVTQVDGIIYFSGGMYSFIEAIAKAFKDLGGEIHLDSKVDNIVTEDNKIVGIASKGKIVNAERVVVDSDYTYSITNLLDFDRDRYIDINDYEYTCSVFMLHLALDKRFDKLLLHNILIAPDFKKNVECIFKGELPVNPSIYIYNPTIIEEVKSNYQTLNCLIRVPNLKYFDDEWGIELKEKMRDRIIGVIQCIPGLERFDEHIVHEGYLTPRDLENKFNSTYGAGFGISPYLELTNVFRPSIKDDEVEGLYFVGDSIHPGAGISIIIKGSKIVSDGIEKV